VAAAFWEGREYSFIHSLLKLGYNWVNLTAEITATLKQYPLDFLKQ